MREDCTETKLDIDYYSILSLNRDCDHLNILKAFENICTEYNLENEDDANFLDDFKSVAEAYEVLSNPKLRLIYDNFGTEGLAKLIPEPYGWANTFVYHGDPMKTYRKLFGSKKYCSELLEASQDAALLEDCQKPREKLCKGKCVIIKLYLTLEEIFFGGWKKMNIMKKVLVNKNSSETLLQQKTLKIPVKPGLLTGSQIVFPEEGDEAPFTIPGDVIFVTEDRPHEIFQRDGSNLLMAVKVSLEESLLGMTITINTIDGRVIRTKITSIITPDYAKIVSGEGLPLVENWRKRGDLVISFKIDFPLYLNVSAKNDIKQAFTGAPKHTVQSDNEYIHRFILDDKMRKYDEPSTPI